MRTACSGCGSHLSGDPADPVVSHGACSAACFEFHGALRDYGAVLREPDPAVAVFAVQVLSDEDPVHYEVALLVHEHETLDRYGDVCDAPSGRLVWTCECKHHALGGEESCKHIQRAVELRALHSRMKAAKKRRQAS